MRSWPSRSGKRRWTLKGAVSGLAEALEPSVRLVGRAEEWAEGVGRPKELNAKRRITHAALSW